MARVSGTFLKALSILQHICIVLMLVVQAVAQNSNNGESPTCHSDHFTCYQDCCLRGEMFCNQRLEKCESCEIRKPLCGNDSLPLECLLYCHKIMNPPLPSEPCDTCVPRLIIIAIAAVAVLVAFVLGCVMGSVCTNYCPVSLRRLLGMDTPFNVCDGNGGEDPGTERMLKKDDGPSPQDVDTHDKLTKVTGHGSFSDSSKSSTAPDIQGLNLTSRASEDGDDNDDNSYGRPHEGGSTAVGCPGAGQREMTPGDAPAPGPYADRHQGAQPYEDPTARPSGNHAAQYDPNAARSQGGPRVNKEGLWMKDDLHSSAARGPGDSRGGASRVAPEDHHLQNPIGSNEIHTTPHFNVINPTKEACDDNGPQRIVIATGAGNPAKTYYHQ